MIVFTSAAKPRPIPRAVILKYVDADILDLDQSIQTWLPDLTVMSKELREQVTIRDLISQRSGIAEYLNAQDPSTPGQTILDSWNAANGRYDLSPSQLVEAALTLGAYHDAGRRQHLINTPIPIFFSWE